MVPEGQAPEHGQHDPQSGKWFCGYWMTIEEWEDVHDYSPPLAKGAAGDGEGPAASEEEGAEAEEEDSSVE